MRTLRLLWIGYYRAGFARGLCLRGALLTGLMMGLVASTATAFSIGAHRQFVPAKSQAAQTPSVAYQLHFEPGGTATFPLQQRPIWKLSIRGKGFDPAAGAICLVFDNWGDWYDIDSLYIDMIHAEPTVDSELFPGNAVVLHAPPSWDGSFEADFVLLPLRAGTKANQRWGMLPRWSPSYSFGQTRNVIPQVFQDAGKVDAAYSVTLSAPPGVSISSDWLGLTAATQTAAIDPTVGNGFLGFGEPLEHQLRSLPQGRLEVIHYGQGQKVAGKIADLVEQLATSISSALGPPADPLVIYISDLGGGGMGTDFGLVLGYEVDTPTWLINSPHYLHFIAHEFFHHWLGSKLRGSETYTWFHEGFTEYFGLWHLAATGAITEQWFRERLLELGLEAIDDSSWGELPFAGQGISWRDDDGPNETMAYKGGAILAFMIDVQLRESGRTGGLQMLRDFLADGNRDVRLSDLKAWAHGHDLDDFWKEYVAGTTVPNLNDWLDRASKIDGFFTFHPTKPDLKD
jgi:M61 glycyl aminopeptidase